MQRQIKIPLYIMICVLVLLTSSLIQGQNRSSNVKKSNYPEPEIFTLNDENILSQIWSPDGDQIAYVTCPPGQVVNCDLKVADWNLKNEKLIYTGIGGSLIEDWVGDWILFIKESNPPGGLETYVGDNELFKIKSDGSELIQITSTKCQPWGWVYDNRGTVAWGRFIPDKNLVYLSAHNCNGWYAPYISSDDGSYQMESLGPGYSFTIGLSPSGNTLYWGDAGYWNWPTSLYVSEWDGARYPTGTLIKVFNDKMIPFPLADEYTVVLSPRNSDNIYAINKDGSNFRLVIDDEFGNYFEDYNPIDGQAFSMRSNRAEDVNYHIFQIYSDGSDIIQLTDGNFNDVGSLYSPDGQYIMYRRQSSDSTNYQLVVKNILVTEIINLIGDVNSLVDGNVLNKGQGNALISKLESALQKYSFKNDIHPENQINAFINQVNDFIDEGILSYVQGQWLIRQATTIMSSLTA